MPNWLIVTKGRARGTLGQRSLLSCGTLLGVSYCPVARCQRAQGPLEMILRTSIQT